MRDIDLQIEMTKAARCVRQHHLDAMLNLGVAGRTIAGLGYSHAPFGIACGHIDGSGAFSPGDGPAHLIQPVIEQGEVVDLVAWRSVQPERWGLRLGIGWALGLDNLGGSSWDGCDANLVAPPLDWLRTGACGLVVLNWNALEIDRLRGFDEIRCCDGMVADLLRSALSRPAAIPNITMEARHAA